MAVRFILDMDLVDVFFGNVSDIAVSVVEVSFKITD